LAGVGVVTMRPLALFRCDASASIGAGHVSRCFALAEALADAGWRIGFTVGADTLAIVPALAKSGFALRVLGADEQDVAVLRTQAAAGADLLVIDHYDKDAVFEAVCRSFAHKILVLDDATGRKHDCDILVDAGAADVECYAGLVPPHARVLTGPEYALLRASFIQHREAALARRDGRPVKEILVSCGATDPANVTSVVLDVLDDIVPDALVTVVLSSKAANVDAISARSRSNVRLLLDVENMADLMTNADLAIGAPGATAYERAVLGLPTVFVVLADNQLGIARLMSGAVAALDAGALDDGFALRLRHLAGRLLADGQTRMQMSRAALSLVDGRGAARIMIAGLKLEPAKDGSSVRLRPADASDEDWLLGLQRQPCTRRHFRNPSAPSRDEHHKWMVRTLADPNRLLLVAEVNGARAGLLRLDRLADQDNVRRHEIAIATDIAYSGRGIALASLRLIRRLMPGVMFDANVLPENKASRALFERSGFVGLPGEVFRSFPQGMR
jgi:UDP-2,4-diacetamido-2,4,6-trideoxy-beta-L-altropyranose hydrolase